MISSNLNNVYIQEYNYINSYFTYPTVCSVFDKGYRYGFNGKERDNGDEGMGGGGSTYDYGFRIYNPNLGKFLSVDPLSTSFPWYSPYHFAGNNTTVTIDLDGLEAFYVCIPSNDGAPSIKIVDNIYNQENGLWLWGRDQFSGTGVRVYENIKLTFASVSSANSFIFYSSSTTYISNEDLATQFLTTFDSKYKSKIATETASVGTSVTKKWYGSKKFKISELFKIFMFPNKDHDNSFNLPNPVFDETFTIEWEKSVTKNIIDVEVVKTVIIDAIDINTDYIKGLKSSLEKKGFIVNLNTQAEGFKGDINYDPGNVNGIVIKGNVKFKYTYDDGTYELKETITQDNTGESVTTTETGDE